MLINRKESVLQVGSIIFDEFGYACPKYSGKFEISLWHMKKEVSNEVNNGTALAGSHVALTTY